MKKMVRLLFALSIASTGSATSAAEENGFYASAGLGRVEPDFSDATFRNSAGNPVAGNTLRQEFDRAPLARLTGGYNWGSWALELSWEQTMKEGDFSIGNVSGTFDYGNLAVTGVYRGSGRLYPLVKLGLSQPDIGTAAANGRLKLGNAAFAGAGLGFRMKQDWSVEFDYTRSGDDMGAFVLGLQKHF